MRRSDDALLGLAGVAFTALYYGARLGGGRPWIAEALYLVPPLLAAGLLARRAEREAGRAAWFFTLSSAGAGLWGAGQVLWTLSVFHGLDPGLTPDVVPGLRVGLNALFLGFLVPMVGALALLPHPRPSQRSAVVLVDAALLVVAVAFVFARLTLLPYRGARSPGGWLLDVLAFLLAAWAAVLWRVVEDAGWKRVYGLLALFATTYGGLSALANGAGGSMPPPGGPLDLAWIVPFFLLAAAALPAPSRPRHARPAALVILLAGPAPLALDLALDLLLPQARGLGHASHVQLLLPVSALLALACALRLRFQERTEARARDEARRRAEEAQRSVRLATLASMSASIVEDLRRATARVVSRASEAEPLLGERGARVVGQARRADGIARDLTAALRLLRHEERKELDLAALLEETLQSAIDGGIGLEVSLEAAGDLSPVSADPTSLKAAVVHLVRNASQASPGGRLRVSAEQAGSQVVVRFVDDGPGVAEEIRPRIFDPFFTTRRLGEGLGLGLTFVHFVAHDLGGSVVLEPGEAGACFALRLPVRPAAEPRPQTHWPLAAAALASAALGTALAVVPESAGRGAASAAFQAASALGAAAALGWAAWRGRGGERAFWLLLAGAPGTWGLVRLFRIVAGSPEGPIASSGGWPFALYTLADLWWVAALLLRPDRPKEGRLRLIALLGGAAVFCLVASLNVYLVLLPAPFAAGDAHLRAQIVAARSLERLLMAVWVAVLAVRSPAPRWRDSFGRLAGVLFAWALGHTLAGAALGRATYRAGSLTDLGWIVPFLLLAALGVQQALERRERLRSAASPAVSPYPLWSAAALLGLAAIPAFHALLASGSGNPPLDAVRGSIADATVFVVGLVLACREVLAHREAALTLLQLRGARSQLVSAERRTRLLGVVGSAIHQLSGHLSSIRALGRLLASQPDLPQRARGDAARIQAGSEAAGRVIRNLLGMVRTAPEALTLVSLERLVREVEEMRGEDLAQQGIRLQATLGQGLPPVPLDAPALQQALLGLVDNAAVAIRGAGRGGQVELTLLLEGNRAVLRVSDDGPGLPPAARRRLSGPVFGPGAHWAGPGLGLHLAREVVAQHGGSIAARNRPEGGAEIEIRLPLAAEPARESASRP